jgi:hypothetical protein
MMGPHQDVECYAGARYPERPLAFWWLGERLLVEAVERRWREPGSLVFQVRVAGDRRFILIYDEVADVWRVEPAR